MQMGISSSELSSDVESHQFPVRKMIRSVGKKQKAFNSQNKCYNSKRKMTHVGNVFFGVECKNRYSILQSDILSSEISTAVVSQEKKICKMKKNVQLKHEKINYKKENYNRSSIKTISENVFPNIVRCNKCFISHFPISRICKRVRDPLRRI